MVLSNALLFFAIEMNLTIVQKYLEPIHIQMKTFSMHAFIQRIFVNCCNLKFRINNTINPYINKFLFTILDPLPCFIKFELSLKDWTLESRNLHVRTCIFVYEKGFGWLVSPPIYLRRVKRWVNAYIHYKTAQIVSTWLANFCPIHFL